MVNNEFTSSQSQITGMHGDTPILKIKTSFMPTSSEYHVLITLKVEREDYGEDNFEIYLTGNDVKKLYKKLKKVSKIPECCPLETAETTPKSFFETCEKITSICIEAHEGHEISPTFKHGASKFTDAICSMSQSEAYILCAKALVTFAQDMNTERSKIELTFDGQDYSVIVERKVV